MDIIGFYKINSHVLICIDSKYITCSQCALNTDNNNGIYEIECVSKSREACVRALDKLTILRLVTTKFNVTDICFVGIASHYIMKLACKLRDEYDTKMRLIRELNINYDPE